MDIVERPHIGQTPNHSLAWEKLMLRMIDDKQKRVKTCFLRRFFILSSYSQAINNYNNSVYCGTNRSWDIKIVPYKTHGGWFHWWILSKETRFSFRTARVFRIFYVETGFR